MSYTLGLILTAASALVSSLLTVILLRWLPAGRVPRASKRDSAATPTERGQPSLESRFLELQGEHAALWSEFEKVLKLLQKLNSRAGMRELRERSAESHQAAPPVGASKVELYRHYGLAGKTPREIAQSQLSLIQNERAN